MIFIILYTQITLIFHYYWFYIFSFSIYLYSLLRHFLLTFLLFIFDIRLIRFISHILRYILFAWADKLLSTLLNIILTFTITTTSARPACLRTHSLPLASAFTSLSKLPISPSPGHSHAFSYSLTAHQNILSILLLFDRIELVYISDISILLIIRLSHKITFNFFIYL